MLLTLLVWVASANPVAPEPACRNEDLAPLAPSELRLRRNHVFARHGRPFDAEDLKAHFGKQPWYRVDPRYSDQRLSANDKRCIQRISLWESSRGVLWQQRADVDGDGAEEGVYAIALDDDLVPQKSTSREEVTEPCGAAECDVALVFGDHVQRLKFVWKPGAYEFIKEPFRVADLDARDPKKEIWFRQHQPDRVDPAILNTFIRIQKDRPVLLEANGVGYSAGQLEFLGNGRLKLRLSPCPEEHAWLELRGDKLVRTRVEKKPEPPHGCAACPFVYTREGDRWVRHGEILRYLVGPRAEAWQSLVVPTSGAASTQLTVRISEEKPETTWIDAVRLHVDGRTLSPRACTDAKGSLCAADGERFMLREGEHLDLVFDLPRGARSVTLEALGYYEPTAWSVDR